MFQFAYRGTSGVPKVKLYPVAANKDISKGEPVNLESGLLDVGAAADTEFVGIANQKSDKAAANTMIEVIEADDETVFKVNYVGTTKTSLSNADIGTAFDLDATDNTSINLDDTTGGAWVYIGGADATAKTCLVKLLSTKRADTVL